MRHEPLAVGFIIATLGSAPLISSATQQQEAAAHPTVGDSCAGLAALRIPDVRVTRATFMPAGPFTPPGARSALTLPAFCRVEAVATPTPDSVINFEVWMPSAAAWSGLRVQRL